MGNSAPSAYPRPGGGGALCSLAALSLDSRPSIDLPAVCDGEGRAARRAALAGTPVSLGRLW